MCGGWSCFPIAHDEIEIAQIDEYAESLAQDGPEKGSGVFCFDLLKDAGTVLNEYNFIAVGDDGKVRYYGVGASQKTSLWLKLTATGTPGHGSTPRPDSAVNKLIEALARIVSYQTPLKVEPQVRGRKRGREHIQRFSRVRGAAGRAGLRIL